jgi:hypothetical protein
MKRKKKIKKKNKIYASKKLMIFLNNWKLWMELSIKENSLSMRFSMKDKRSLKLS